MAEGSVFELLNSMDGDMPTPGRNYSQEEQLEPAMPQSGRCSDIDYLARSRLAMRGGRHATTESLLDEFGRWKSQLCHRGPVYG